MDCPGKLRELAEGMRDAGIDLVLLFDRDNVRYFTGFRLNRASSSILAVDRDGKPTYIVAQLDFERAKRECWIEDIIPFPEDTPNYLSVLEALLRGRVERIGVEKRCLTLEQAEYVRELFGNGVELVDVERLVAELRAVKSEEELERIRHAAGIASRVMGEVLREARPGVTEAELVGLAEYLLRREGAEGSSFEPFLMSGEEAAWPRRVASGKPLREGELALLDMGAVYEGYCSDITRTFAVGEADRERKRIFAVAWKAQEAALAAIRPGIRAAEVDRVAREVIEAEGLGKYFPHLTGHGVGVSIHEAPILDRGVDTVLSPGMVVTVEPGVYVPGVGAARVEDMVVVTRTGCEILTDAPRDLV